MAGERLGPTESCRSSWDVSDCSGQSPAQAAQCEFLDTLLQGVQSETGVYLFQLTTTP